MAQRAFSPDFFLQSTVTVAKALLGAKLSTTDQGITTSGRIVEVEAYCGVNDPAAHSARGRTPRTEVMFRRGGLCYVYFIYGAHYCVNVVTGREGKGEAVLIRALEPLDGIETMRRRRRMVPEYELTNGPGKLCQALAIGPGMYGEDFLCSDKISLIPGSPVKSTQIVRGKRIGISKAVDRLWRFYLKDNPFVSR